MKRLILFLILVTLILFVPLKGVAMGEKLTNTTKSLFQDGDFEMQVNENYKKAIAYYKAGLKKQPDSDIAYSRIASCYSKLGKYRLAEDNIQKAIALDPEQPYHYYLLGMVQRKEKKNSDAVFSLNKALEVAKATNNKKWDAINNNSTYAHLGTIYFNEIQYEKAIDCFKKAICEDTNIRVYAYYCLGLSYLRLNKTEDAKKSFLKMTEIKDELHYASYLNWSLETFGYDIEKLDGEELDRLINEAGKNK